MIRAIKLQCPNCGANLEIDSSLKQCFCQYCGTKILLHEDDPISTYVSEFLANERLRAESERIRAENERLRLEQTPEYLKKKAYEDRMEQKRLDKIKRDEEYKEHQLQQRKIAYPQIMSLILGLISFSGISKKAFLMFFVPACQICLCWTGYWLLHKSERKRPFLGGLCYFIAAAACLLDLVIMFAIANKSSY